MEESHPFKPYEMIREEYLSILRRKKLKLKKLKLKKVMRTLLKRKIHWFLLLTWKYCILS